MWVNCLFNFSLFSPCFLIPSYYSLFWIIDDAKKLIMNNIRTTRNCQPIHTKIIRPLFCLIVSFTFHSFSLPLDNIKVDEFWVTRVNIFFRFFKRGNDEGGKHFIFTILIFHLYLSHFFNWIDKNNNSKLTLIYDSYYYCYYFMYAISTSSSSSTLSLK
jgi:hypothetical protein